MSHFYGVISGKDKNDATQCGSVNSGLTVTAASWHGAIRTELYCDAEGRDCFRVLETPWKGAGRSRVIAEGRIGQD